MNVTGTGGACATTADPCSGGTIQSTTQDAVSLISTQGVTLQRMKIRNSLKSLKDRHRDCRVIRRRGRTYVINKTNRRFKARQG